MPSTDSWIHRPRQKRSADTLDAIVAATIELLDEKGFREISIAEIMQRAGMAVGTFYQRFRNKEALLPYLYERYDVELARQTGEVLQPESWTGLDLTERVQRIVDLCVDMYRSHRGLWRAMLIHAASNTQLVTAIHRRRRREMVQRIATLLLERSREITHPDPEQAVEFCLIVMFATCKDTILLAERSHGTIRLTDRRLKEELARTLLGHLGVGRRGRKKARR